MRTKTTDKNSRIQDQSDRMEKSESQMWHEFNSHFTNKERGASKGNHHDFLEPITLPELKQDDITQNKMTEFSTLKEGQ
eukprot:CAMPEP_0170542180 /NCGR_PEP_ID=MMETSP0211-20121228/1687_1 /TAXON_ID=311385 /ORGANISM="Pseudokeronopsis sp., Strain OXSARD2" /LENGTH=78 /DNA_ID=CAMNT_0010845159 /DNA_START=233 /DNA_END=469 /DNA_ORIENTATION=-